MSEQETVVVEERIDEPERRVYTFKVTQLIWLIFGIIEGLILIRVVLKLIAANPAAPFAAFIYAVTEPFLQPFIGLTGTPSAGGVVLELSSIIAVIVYALLAWLIVKIIDIAFYSPRARRVTSQTTRQDEL